MKSLLAVTLLLTSAFGQSAAANKPTTQQLLGTWRLISVNVTLKDGTVKPDAKFGPHAMGFIMYEPDGYMCAQIMNPDHMTWQLKHQPTDAEKLASYDSMLSYCGTYRLDAEHSTVTHEPQVAWSPLYAGSSQPRPFRIEGNRLIITPPNPYPEATKWVLTWERVK